MPLIPALGRKRQEDLCEFKVSLVYKESSRSARAVTPEKPCFKTMRERERERESERDKFV